MRVVVETPRGSGLKLKYEPSLRVFELSRILPLGLTYPYDWGFIPGTVAEDGDPLDAMVVTDVASYPGVVIACRPLGVVLLDQKEEDKKKRERNDRLVLVPAQAERLADLTDPDSLPKRMQEEIEQFFLNSVFFTEKHARVLGWKGPKHADKLIDASRKKK